ncbi:TetR/AcrR family transcriptional regulator [Cupriavidus agavae]|uniref:TetR family transcriptional regulator n=1 Tax=Cupriavidus agavae TaxID=1001822 RepID=A0A4V2FGH9_9BURK|nr:TetR/AcrR family transcriptional regulator [Cupriavidus agavae]RZT36839.1 TetR family transcriptional regulator [Cupriavidus agavae]
MKPLGRKGAATRQAILVSARQAFTERGYDVGVREIAENAGVTAMLVNRYFGSKEELFEEVVELVLSAPGILTEESMRGAPDLSDFCRRAATALVAKTAPEQTPLDGFLIMLRSANHPPAAKILRKAFEAHFAAPLASLLPGADPNQRAAMFLSVIAGFQVMRQIVELDGLTDADPSGLAAQLEAMFGVLIVDGARMP